MKTLLESKISSMSDNDLLNAVYCDPLTGMWNRAAFELAPATKLIAIIDLDSLKWVNDLLGHRKGDLLLQHIAGLLIEAFPDRAFRLSGDEFIVKLNNLAEFEVLNRLDRFYSFGIGTDLVMADDRLRVDKMTREQNGKRACRGERPAYKVMALLETLE